MAHVINGIFYFTYHVQHTCGIFVPGVGPPGLCTLALLLNSQVIMQSLATCRQVPLCVRCTSTSQKCYEAQIYICSVLKDGRAFLGTLALDSTALCGSPVLVYLLCVHSNSTSTLWMTALSHSFFFFLSLFPVLALYGVYFV